MTAFLELAATPDSRIIPLYENNRVKVIPAFCAKDGMQLKPGLVFDERQGILVGSTDTIDYKYVKTNPSPDKDHLRKTIVQEAECIALTTADIHFGIPVGVNYIAKGLNSKSNSAHFQKLSGLFGSSENEQN